MRACVSHGGRDHQQIPRRPGRDYVLAGETGTALLAVPVSVYKTDARVSVRASAFSPLQPAQVRRMAVRSPAPRGDSSVALRRRAMRHPRPQSPLCGAPHHCEGRKDRNERGATGPLMRIMLLVGTVG
jgi:hypothetical protein